MLYVNPLDSVSGRFEAAGEAQRERMALRELEQFFAYMILQEMRKTIPKDELFGDSQARQVYESFMDDALARNWAESGQLGLAQQMQDQLNQARVAMVARGAE